MASWFSSNQLAAALCLPQALGVHLLAGNHDTIMISRNGKAVPVKLTMRVVLAGDVRVQAPIPADVVHFRGQVLGHCQLEPRAVSHGEEVLHHALAKGALTHNYSTAVVVEGTWSGQHTATDNLS